MEDITDSDSSLSLHTIEDSEFENPNSNFNRAFDYIDWDSCPNIIKAVLRNDTDGVRQIMLKQPNAINSRDQLNNTPLHMAYLNQNLDIINILVSHPDVDLESRNFEGETPLMKSILGQTSDAVVLKLLDAGCNINTKDSVGRTPLHAALNFQRTIVEELIKRGANLNTPCGCGGPALFHAINISSLELLSMLLYYNADTSIKNENNITPFLYSLDTQFNSLLAYEILPYVVDFSVTNPAGLNCFLLALQYKHPIAMDILQVIDYESLNQVDCEGNSALYYSLFYDNCSIFKELFLRIDHNILLKCRTPLIATMLSNNIFHNSSWIECFYLCASSNIFAMLMQDFLTYLDTNRLPLFAIISKFNFDGISQIDRERIIYIFLSYGVQVFFEDIINYYKNFGPCSDLNILLSFKICGDEPLTCSPFLSYIFAQEVRKSYTDLERDILVEIKQSCSINLVNILRFFTFPFTNTELFIPDQRGNNILDIGLKKFQVPSLLELCRNEIRFKVRSDFGITTTNEFYEAVEKLVIPKNMKNLILFKTPLY